MKYDKPILEKLFFLISIIILVLVPAIKYGDFYHYDETMREEWFSCLQDLEEGGLYKTDAYEKDLYGKTYCWQGPVVFLTLKLFQKSLLGFLFP